MASGIPFLHQLGFRCTSPTLEKDKEDISSGVPFMTLSDIKMYLPY
ncbi:11527_t:CDS:2 [Funneliformis caledonium]|uniref:11527_t:CDS:1 n=1 Tax=Funneliformis caledonium TaxID=1117310 RepID=A0A9N9CR14_9GLOM|nr:11527_t:CDS:2 [Funneliformis caledonium]